MEEEQGLPTSHRGGGGKNRRANHRAATWEREKVV